MTNEEIQEFFEMFGDRLPNFEQYPNSFAYYGKLFKYYKSLEVKPDDKVVNL